MRLPSRTLPAGRARPIAVLPAGLLVVVLMLALHAAGVLQGVEDATVDQRFAHRKVPAPTGITVVDIGEDDITRLGRWPLSRRVHAKVVDRLRRAGARAIVYDVQFSEQSDDVEADWALYQALGRAGGGVLASGTSDDRGRTRILGGPENLARIDADVGAANLGTQTIVRWYGRRVGRLDTLAVATAERLTGRPLSGDAFRDGRARIDFRGGPGTFPTVSFADVYRGRIRARRLAGQVVVVGASAPTLQDLHPTSVSRRRLMSGPEIQANAIWTALRGNPLRGAPPWVDLAAIVLLAALAPLARLRLGILPTVALTAAASGAFAVAAQAAFAQGVLVAVAAPLFGLGSGLVAAVVGSYVDEIHTRRRITRYSRRLEAEVRARTAEVRETQLEIIHRLSHAAEQRDEDTGAHIKRIGFLTERLSLALGLTPDEAECIGQASPLHDVGKIGVPDRVLLKPGRLDEEERRVMQHHTMMGAEILAGSRSPVLQMAETIARAHHERWDGDGYPAGLAGEAIPLPGRIAAVCDVFDALVSERPYKRAWTFDEALDELLAQRGTHFDPRVVDAFARMLPDVREELRAMLADRRPGFTAVLAPPPAAEASAPPAARSRAR